MENVVYQIESDPSRAIAANKKLADSFDQVNSVTVNTLNRFERFSNVTERTGLSVARNTEAWSQLNKATGGTKNQISGIADVFDNLSDPSIFFSAVFPKAAKSIGTFGTVSL